MDNFCTPNLIACLHFMAISLERQLLRKHHVGTTQYCILRELTKHEEPLSMGRISQLLKLKPSSISTASNKLEALKLVKRDCKKDKRAVILNTTSQGLAHLKNINATIRAEIVSLCAPLNKTQIETLIQSSLSIVHKKNGVGNQTNKIRAYLAYYESILIGHKTFEELARKLNISLVEFLVIYLCYTKSPEALQASSISHELIIKNNVLSTTNKTLLSKKLIKISKDKADKRLIFISVTSRGKKLVERAIPDLNHILKVDIYETTEKEREAFLEITDAIMGAQRRPIRL